MSLTALETRYLGAADASIRANSQVSARIDGVEYFDAIARAIAATGVPGDLIYIAGWRLDVQWDLTGKKPTDPGHTTFLRLLAQKAHAGVDVRLVYSAHVSRAAGSIAGFELPMGQLLRAAIALRSEVPAGASAPPLADRILLDFSGALFGSHHQKFTAIKAGTETVAFVGGIDYLPLRRDSRAHARLTWSKDGSAYGWHDAGIEVRGEAVRGVFETFASRWNEAATLPRRTFAYRRAPFTRHPINPGVVAAPPAVPTPSAVPAGTTSVKVVRSRFPLKLPDYGGGGTPWDNGAGLTEFYDTLVAAIGGAERWIYLEDQYLGDQMLGPLPSERVASAYSLMPHLRAAARRGVKLVLVGSGKNDGDPPPFALVNQTFDEAGDVKEKITDVLDAEAAAAGTASASANVAVWRMDVLTVHSKVLLIDDRFAAIGSGNIMQRSMYGNDSELQIAVVDDGAWVTALRKSLWAEHVKIGPPPWPAAVDAALDDVDLALGLWKPQWLPATAPQGLWSATGRPAGFAPTGVARTYVGPE